MPSLTCCCCKLCLEIRLQKVDSSWFNYKAAIGAKYTDLRLPASSRCCWATSAEPEWWWPRDCSLSQPRSAEAGCCQVMGTVASPFSRGLASSWSKRFGEQHKVWTEQIVEERRVRWEIVTWIQQEPTQQKEGLGGGAKVKQQEAFKGWKDLCFQCLCT